MVAVAEYPEQQNPEEPQVQENNEQQPDAQQPGHESSSYVIKLIDNDLIVETQVHWTPLSC